VTSSARARIAVLYNVDFERQGAGGASYEADAEVRETADAVAHALEKHGYTPELLAVDDELSPLERAAATGRFAAVFNLVESLGGDAAREPDVPELLDRLGVAYTGNSAPALRVAHAKDRTRRRLAEHGVPIPGGVAVGAGEVASVAAAQLRYPLFVKPARTDASIGIDQSSIVRDASALARRLEQLATLVPGPYLVEEYLPGREVNVAIFPEPIEGHLVCTHIDFSACAEGVAPIVTYDCKWRPGTPDYNARSLPSSGILSAEEIAAARSVARAAFLAIGATSYGRVDLRGGADGRFYVIDVNPNPDIHPEAGMSIAARSIGVEHDALAAGILRTALARRSP
jgi:D-alanine-D-alanine ligase